MLFSCNLDVPRTDIGTGFPAIWLDDKTISHAAFGWLVYLLSFLSLGVVMSANDLDELRPGSEDPAMENLVLELHVAGYLRPIHAEGSEEHYELVHPDRLGPFPVQASK